MVKALEALDIRVHFEGVKALDGIDVVLRAAEILGVIGPNGAGKTTLINVMSGFQRPTTGRVVLEGTDVTSRAAHQRARLGLARTFQNVRIFRRLSVLENVELGAVGSGRSRREARQLAWSLLPRLGLAEKAGVPAGSLAFGEERRVGLLRAVSMAPKFLLLDEPAAGLNETETDELKSAIKEIRSEVGCGVLVVEHDMRLIMGLCERIQVLDYGKTISIGNPEEVQGDPAVITAYLGTKGARDVPRP